MYYSYVTINTFTDNLLFIIQNLVSLVIGVMKKKNFTSFGQPNKADHLCQLWQSSSNLFVDHVCVWMCQCQKGPQYPLTKSYYCSCQPTVCAYAYSYEWRCPIVKCHLYCIHILYTYVGKWRKITAV